MNIVKWSKELGISEFDTALGEDFSPIWKEEEEAEPVWKIPIVRAAGQQKIHVPASSRATVYARGFRRQFDRTTTMLLEPGNTPLPSGLVVVLTIVSPNSHVFPVQVINNSPEDVRLPHKARLGSLTECKYVERNLDEVKFQWISDNHEEVTIRQKEGQESDSDPWALLDRLHLGGT